MRKYPIPDETPLIELELPPVDGENKTEEDSQIDPQ